MTTKDLSTHPLYLEGVRKINEYWRGGLSFIDTADKLLALEKEFVSERGKAQAVLNQGTILDQGHGHELSDRIDIYGKLAEDASWLADSAKMEGEYLRYCEQEGL